MFYTYRTYHSLVHIDDNTPRNDTFLLFHDSQTVLAHSIASLEVDTGGFSNHPFAEPTLDLSISHVLFNAQIRRCVSANW